MKKKHLVVVGVIILSAIVILGLYQTFALSSDITKDTSGYYNVTITDGTTITVPAGSTKTVYYKLTNTNKGIVKYGVGYSGTNITVKYYTDTIDPVTGTVDYGKSKYIKLSVENSGTVSSTATLSTILGYENGGDLIVPSGVTLVTEKKSPLSSYITNLYNNATKTAVINNSITYQYDPKNSLMKDVGNNIRYYGASPNNYIYFNCSNYSNQSSSTCETWRIIGVFDGKIKLIRNESIGEYSWDNKNVSTGAENDYGKNDWTDARLMKLLNPGYESKTTGGSLYYNAKSGNCYSGQSNATKACNFTSTGIKNATTRNLISDTIYYLGGHNSFSVYPNQIYEKERGTTVYSGRPTEWTGKIALAYPSDYGYAADLGKCSQNLNNYNNSTCTSNNWMKAIVAPNYGWLLTPRSGIASNVWYVYSSGGVYYNSYVYNAYGVAPVLFLNSDANVKSGTGTSSDPYQISV
ncbi:MAG: hypothetical protein ACLT1G_03275 [Bacilli bacterium]